MSEFISFIKTLVEGSKSRVKNPFIFAFVCGWIVFNWRALGVFFGSGKDIEGRIEIINFKYSDWGNNLWLPLIYALVYIVVLPYIMAGIDRLLRLAKELRLEFLTDYRKTEIDEQILIVEKEIELEDKRARNRDKEELNNQIKKLTDKNNSLNERYETQLSDFMILEDKSKGLDASVKQLELDKNKLTEELLSIKREYKDKLVDYEKNKELLTANELSSLATSVKRKEEQLLEFLHFKSTKYYNEFSRIMNIVNSNSIPGTLSEKEDVFIKGCLRWGIVKVENNTYKFTLKGEEFLKFFRERKNVLN